MAWLLTRSFAALIAILDGLAEVSIQGESLSVFQAVTQALQVGRNVAATPAPDDLLSFAVEDWAWSEYAFYALAWCTAIAVKLRGPPCQRRALLMLHAALAQVAPGSLDASETPTASVVDSPLDETAMATLIDSVDANMESEDTQLGSEERA